LAAVERLLDAGFDLSTEELAIFGASHAGQPLHVGILEKLLARAGLPVAALGCGTHAPWHGPTAKDLARRGLAPSPLHHNCAGKHAAMLLAARVSGEPLDSYLDPEHPVQVRNRATLAAFAGCRVDDVGVDVDGCGAPTFSLALPAAARAFASLVDESRPSRALDLLRAAVAAEPVAYCGDGRTCTRFLQAFGGGVWPKAGAEGFYGVALPALRAGWAFKVEDGATRAVEPWVAAALLRHAAPDAARRPKRCRASWRRP
jgi:L-asparaginase II